MSRWQVVAVFLAAALVAGVPLFVFGWQAADETEREVRRGRLQLAQLAATQADHILMEAFFEVELMASRVLSKADTDGGCLRGGTPSPADPEPANFRSTLYALDCDGRVVFAEPAGESARLNGESAAELFADAAAAPDRYISGPFFSPTSGHPTVGLSLPLYGEGGARLGTIVGLMDLEEHFSVDLVEVVERLGSSGHADLIGAQGKVLASTRHTQSATEGDHPDFYREVATTGTASVERVRHIGSALEDDHPPWHLMAYSALRGAPWGVAIGASEAESFDAARRQRRSVIRLGVAGLAALMAGSALVAFTARSRDAATPGDDG